MLGRTSGDIEARPGQRSAATLAQHLDAVEMQAVRRTIERPDDEDSCSPMTERCTGADLDTRLGTRAAPTAPLAGSLDDVSVGIDSTHADGVDADAAYRAHAASFPPLPIDPVGTIELTAKPFPRLDPSRDVASLVFGRAAAPLVIRLRWVLAVIASLGAPTPTIVTFAVHWASGGVGQFAIAYEWPLWLEVWWCVGYWVSFGVVVLLYGSLQRELAWIALKQPSTLWIIAMCVLWGAGFVSLHDFGIQRSTWVTVPLHVTPMLFFPLVAMAEAMPPAVRLSVLRYLGLVCLGGTGMIAIALRLPTAEQTPGKLVWTVMGTDTVTNLQVATYSATVIAVLLAEGVMRAWVFPNELAFIRTSVRFRVRAAASAGATVAAANSPASSAVDDEPHLHDAVRGNLVGETAATRISPVPSRSGRRVHPGQTESTLPQQMSDFGRAIESGRFTSVVTATTSALPSGN